MRPRLLPPSSLEDLPEVDLDPERVERELARGEEAIEEKLPALPPMPTAHELLAGPPETEPQRVQEEQPKGAQPQRLRRGFMHRIADMRKNAQRGVLPETNELEAVLLAISLRKLNSTDKKESADGLDMLMQIYGRRSSAKFAPGNNGAKKPSSEHEPL